MANKDSKGLKVNFWYDNKILDAICISKFEGEDLILKKTYKVDEIADILKAHYLSSEANNE
jgi:hypothetical protein